MPPKKDKGAKKDAPKLDVGAADEDEDGPPKPEAKEYIPWSWQDGLEGWAGSSTAQLKAARNVFRSMYVQKFTPPSFSSEEWQSVVMRHMDPHPSLRAELAVQMLVSLLVNDRKVGIAAADSMETPLYIAASIRCQRGQASNERMFELMESWFDRMKTIDGADASLMNCIVPLWQKESSPGETPKSWRDIDSRDLKFVPRTSLTREVIRWGIQNTPTRRISRLQKSISDYRQQSEDIDSLPELEPDLEQTFEEMTKAKSTLRAHRAVQQHMSDSNKDHHKLQTRISVEGTTSEIKKVIMQQFVALEKHFHEMASDNEMLIELWTRVDLNSNGELGFNEVTSFLSAGYPLLANMPALRKAFDISSSDDVSGSHVIKPVAFRNFLGNVFFYNKIFLAFDLIDTDKDHHISREEWDDGHGRRFFQKFLNVMDIEWEKIAAVDESDRETLSFNQVCKWYLDEHQHTLAMFREGGMGGLLSPTQRNEPLPRTLDADSFTGLVLHACYITRSGEGSVAMCGVAAR